MRRTVSILIATLVMLLPRSLSATHYTAFFEKDFEGEISQHRIVDENATSLSLDQLRALREAGHLLIGGEWYHLSSPAGLCGSATFYDSYGLRIESLLEFLRRKGVNAFVTFKERDRDELVFSYFEKGLEYRVYSPDERRPWRVSFHFSKGINQERYRSMKWLQ